jgi:hypothetical protein
MSSHYPVKERANADTRTHLSFDAEVAMNVQIGILFAAIVGLVVLGAWFVFVKFPEMSFQFHQMQFAI